MKLISRLIQLLTLYFLIIPPATGSDSLIQLLPEAKGKERVDILVSLVRQNSRNNQDVALEYGKEAVELARKTNYPAGEANALLQMSTAYYYLSDYSQAIEYLIQNLEIRKRLNDSVMMADAYNKISVNLRMIGRFEEALTYSFQSLQIGEQSNDTVHIAAVLNNIGGIFRNLDDYSRALDYYTRAHEIHTNLNNKAGIAQTSNNIGIIHRINGNYQKALEYYQISLRIDEEMGNLREVAQSYNNIASIYNLMQEYDLVQEALDKSLKISSEINNLESQSVALFLVGDISLKQNKPSEAIKAYERALAIAEQTGNQNRRQGALSGLIETFTKKGDYRQAVKYYELLIKLNENIHQEQIKAIVSEIEEKYEFDKKMREIENLKQENKIKALQLTETRRMTYSLAGFSFAIMIIAVLFIQKNRLSVKQRTTELEQKLFRSQMNPHFIFNALNAIQGFIYKNKPAEAGKYMSNFARMIRLVLTNSRAEFISLENEIKTLEYYMQLQQLRFKHKFDFQFQIDPEIDAEYTMVPPMLAQPFLENSIEHGIQQLAEQGLIKIAFTRQEEHILLEIEDNGIGINQSMKLKSPDLTKHESLALTITEERLKLLNKRKSNKIALNIQEITDDNNAVKGTRVTFNIPYLNAVTINNN